MDLGIEGAYMPFRDIAVITLAPDTTSEQKEKHPEAIKLAYENQGYTDILIKEIKPEEALNE